MKIIQQILKISQHFLSVEYIKRHWEVHWLAFGRKPPFGDVKKALDPQISKSYKLTCSKYSKKQNWRDRPKKHETKARNGN